MTNEIQRLSFSETAISGMWTASFSEYTTSNLPYDADAADVQEALEALPSIGAGNVVVFGDMSIVPFPNIFAASNG